MKTQNTKPRIIALFALMLLMLTQYAANAQNTVKRDVKGNFQTITATKQKTVTDSLTTYTFTDGHGKAEPVYVGSKGSYYVARTSKKSGNYYRKYLKTEENN